MADFPTFRDHFRIARDEMMVRNSNLSRTIIEREGSDANAITSGIAAVGDEVTGQLIAIEASLFLDSAQGRKLDRLVFDRYGLTRKPASVAQTSVTFSTTSPAPGPFSIPVGTRLQTADGRMWQTVAAASYPGGATSIAPVPVRSVKAGLDQQVAANTITSIVDVPLGSPPDLKVTNALASAGADNEESDEDLRNRARLFFTTARRGTLRAIEQGALAVPGVRRATAFEAIDSGGRPARFVELVVADAFTDVLVSVSPTPPSYQAQSQVLAGDISSALTDVRAAGIYVKVVVAQVVLLGVSLGLTFLSGVDTAAVALAARSAIIGYVNGLSPGQKFVRADAQAALEPIVGLHLTGNEILAPAGDVVAETLQVFRTSLSLVVVSGT
jgi:uncharacterized phage protein gp47/JayE